MENPKLPELGEELFLFMGALRQMKPGEDAARLFARTLSGTTLDSFAEALQRILAWISLFYQHTGMSADAAGRECGKFEAVATSEYARLRVASGATNAARG